MKPYKGIVQLACKSRACQQPQAKNSIDAACLNCSFCTLQILDFEGRVIAQYYRPPKNIDVMTEYEGA